uniref:Uncharacterized protein n=1 Tax=Oryza rufipogon TaxID=4529 RepID=A0A0E0QXQ0_ORYRU
MGKSKKFQRMIRNAFCPQYTQVSRKTTKNNIVVLYLGGCGGCFHTNSDAMGLDYSKAYQHARDELFRVFRLYQTELSVARRVPKKTPQKKKQSKSSAMNLWKKIRGKEQASSSGSRSNWNSDVELNHYLNTNPHRTWSNTGS